MLIDQFSDCRSLVFFFHLAIFPLTPTGMECPLSSECNCVIFKGSSGVQRGDEPKVSTVTFKGPDGEDHPALQVCVSLEKYSLLRHIVAMWRFKGVRRRQCLKKTRSLSQTLNETWEAVRKKKFTREMRETWNCLLPGLRSHSVSGPMTTHWVLSGGRVKSMRKPEQNSQLLNTVTWRLHLRRCLPGLRCVKLNKNYTMMVLRFT